MINRSDRLKAGIRTPTGRAFVAAALAVVVVGSTGYLLINAYRTQVLIGGPISIFEASGLIGLAVVTGLVYISINRHLLVTEARHRETELLAREARNQALLNAVPDLMFRLTRDGTFLDYHAEPTDMVMPPESVIGANLRQTPMPPEVVDRILEKIEAALDTNHIQLLEYTLPTAGSDKDFEARMVACALDEVVAIVRNITERKQAEQSLHRWAHIFEHAEWGVAIGSGDGRTLEMMNPAYAKMHGFTVEELSNMPIASVYAPGTAEELRGLIQHTNETGHGVLESLHIRKDGSVLPVMVDLTAVKDDTGQVLYRVANVQDITARKQAEAALREREEQYRSIFEASLDGLFIIGLDGHIIDLNPAGARMHGYTVEECRGLRAEQLVPPDRLFSLQEFIDTVQAGRQFNVRGTNQRKDGSTFPVEVVGTQFIYRGEPHALAIVRDITERVQVEETLHERELQYRGVFESSLDGLAINDLDGALVEFNPAMAYMHGYTVDEFRQIQPGQFIHPDSRPLFVEYMDTVRTGREYRCRAVDVRKDGSTFYVDVVGTPFTLRGEPHAFAIVRDISAQVAAEAALREREEQYRSIFQSVSDGLFIDTIDGEMVDFNPAVAEMHGYTKEEFRDIPTIQIIHPDSLHLFQEFVTTVRSGQQYRCRAVDVRKDGSLFHVEVTGIPFMYRSQPHMLAVLHDITAQVQAEQQLEQRVVERTRELSTLLDVSYNVASTLELEPLLQLILDQLKILVEYHGAALFGLHGSDLTVLEYRGPLSTDRRHLPADWWALNLDMITRGEVILIPDTQGDTPLARRYREWAGNLMATQLADTFSLLAIPLTSKDSVIGLISLTYNAPNHFTEQHINLVRAIANHAAIALENARLFTEAQGKAVLEERQRLARDLHDSVTQSLYSLTLLAEASRRLVDQDVLKAARYLGDMGEIAQQSLKEMRLLVYQLRPLALEREGIVGALQARLDSVEKRAGVEARFLIEGNLSSLSPVLEEALFRIAQEALNNSLKHAAARSVVVRLRGDDDCVRLEVADDGRGSALLVTTDTGGLGLTSMRERVTQLRGTLSMESAPGQGTRIAVEVPRSLITEE